MTTSVQPPLAASDAPAARLAAIPPPPRAAVRSEHQAIVVVERRLGRQGDPKVAEMVPGWQWILANARVGDLYDQLFADAKLTWSSLVCPEEQEATFASLSPLMSSQQSLLAYDGNLQLSKNSLTAAPDDGEPLYLLFNGHRFPICDLNDAILVHRQNRCDATLLDFPRIRAQGVRGKNSPGR